MGVVYRAHEVQLNRVVALKMILAADHADSEAILRFRSEAEMVASLHHHNIVQIHAIGECDGRPFFNLEYVEGGSLSARLDGIPWNPRDAAALVEALARGIHEAHKHSVVHRDIKPANILLTYEGVPKISDFGLAKTLNKDSDLTRTESIMGSPSYMSPEQAHGHARLVGIGSDIYALGANFYELLTGRPPFRGSSILETLDQVKKSEPVAPSRLVPGLPRDLETICLKCLEKEPRKRYESAQELADDLKRYLHNEPILARRVGAGGASLEVGPAASDRGGTCARHLHDVPDGRGSHGPLLPHDGQRPRAPPPPRREVESRRERTPDEGDCRLREERLGQCQGPRQ